MSARRLSSMTCARIATALTEAVREVRIRAPREQLANGARRLKDLLRRHPGSVVDLSASGSSTTAARRSSCWATAIGSRRPSTFVAGIEQFFAQRRAVTMSRYRMITGSFAVSYS